MAQGRIPLLHSLFRVLNQLLLSPAGRVVVNTDLFPAFSAQKAVYRHMVVFSRQIPERDINSGQRSHDSRSAEMRKPVKILPMVLDIQGSRPTRYSFITKIARAEASRNPQVPLSPKPEIPSSVSIRQNTLRFAHITRTSVIFIDIPPSFTGCDTEPTVPG